MKDLWKKIKYRIGRFFVIYLERVPYINWFNPFITLYINFRSFPLKQAWKLPLFAYGWPKLFSLYGSMECDGVCRSGMIVFNKTNCGMPNNPGTNTAINNWGKIIFRGKCQIYTSNKINVAKGACLSIGENSKISMMCNITAFKSVHIGSNTQIAHRCQIIDTNYHFTVDFNKKKVHRLSNSIFIGDYCWICNSSSISGGAIIPNKTIIASNSLVNKDFSDCPEESIIGGAPAKLIKTGIRRVNSKRTDKLLLKYFADNPDKSYYILETDDHSICDAD